MTDLERRLRDLLDEEMRRAPTSARAPSRLRTRVRRRQLGTVLISALVVVALAAGSFLALRPFVGGRTPASGSGERQMLHGFEIGVPEGWTLIDWWPSIVGYTIIKGDTLTGGPAGGPLAIADVFELSSYDPGIGIQSCSGTSKEFPSDGVCLVVAFDGAKVNPAPRDPWPVQLEASAMTNDPPYGGPYGSSTTSRFWVGDQPYLAWVVLGPQVSVDDQGAAFDAFNGMQVQERRLDGIAGPADGPPTMDGYLLAGGVQGDTWWSLEASMNSGSTGPYWPVVHLIRWPSLHASEGRWAGVVGASADAPPATPAAISSVDSYVGDLRVIYGTVPDAATDVEFRPQFGEPVPGNLVPIPEWFGTAAEPVAYQFFWIRPGGQYVGTVVATEPGGKTVSAPIDLGT